MADMTVAEAILKAAEIHTRRREDAAEDFDEATLQVIKRIFGTGAHPYVRQSGKAFVYLGSIERGLQNCPICGGVAGMGQVIIAHTDVVGYPLIHCSITTLRLAIPSPMTWTQRRSWRLWPTPEG